MTTSNNSPLSDARIRTALSPFGLNLGNLEVSAIRKYMDILTLWNQKVSLTSLNDPTEILQRHFGESMFGAMKVPILDGRLADFGSGAGFPGVALKIMRPSLDVLLIEPNAKKAAFLGEVTRKLGLDGLTVFRGRAEAIPVKNGQFTYVTARAVRGYEDLLSWAEMVLVEGGKVVLWLGVDEAMRLRSVTPWHWSDPIPVPVSRKRVILVGLPERS